MVEVDDEEVVVDEGSCVREGSGVGLQNEPLAWLWYLGEASPVHHTETDELGLELRGTDFRSPLTEMSWSAMGKAMMRQRPRTPKQAAAAR